MSAHDILARLRSQGVAISLDRGKLRLRPWMKLSAKDRDDVQKHWKAIIAEVAREDVGRRR